MWQFLAGFAACWLLGGLATTKFITDAFANEGREAPTGGQVVTLALWPRMLWVIGKD